MREGDCRERYCLAQGVGSIAPTIGSYFGWITIGWSRQGLGAPLFWLVGLTTHSTDLHAKSFACRRFFDFRLLTQIAKMTDQTAAASSAALPPSPAEDGPVAAEMASNKAEVGTEEHHTRARRGSNAALQHPLPQQGMSLYL